MARLNGFALNAFTTQPLSLEKDAAVCRTLRVEALELTENKLAMDLEKARAQLERLRETRVEVVSAQPTVHSPFPDRLAPHSLDPADRLGRVKGVMDYFTELGLRDIPVVLISGAAPDYDFCHAWETVPSWFREATAHVQARGFWVAF
jgi:hypothetical protein